MSMNKRPTKEETSGAFARLFKMIWKYYPGYFILVIISTLIVSFASVANSYFVGNILVDQFIQPALDKFAMNNPLGTFGNAYQIMTTEITVFNLHFFEMIGVMIGIFALGVLASYSYNFFMAYIAQGLQKRIRDEMFAHMEDLPVSYFDKHTHGDIMSVYTNDVDSLREMLARSIPMMLSSLMAMIACFVIMLMTDLYLMAVVLLFATMMFMLTKFFASHSGRHFVQQQIQLGKTNGYVEEMVAGQKVVKVFNYEERNIEGFTKVNDALYEESVKANRYANTLMPTVNQLGNVQYALLALLGGLFVVNGIQGYTLLPPFVHTYSIGIIISFLLYSKSFVQPIGQMAQQLNTVTMALAGASRIFAIIDEPAEIDEGYVELVNAKEDENGNPVEVKERTGKWAWKHPHTDGSETTYTWLKGKINVNHVDFGYTPDKIVLHDITVYAEPGQKVAFVGPTGAGKTTIGKVLSQMAGLTFIDLDYYIEGRFRKTISQLFAERGEEGFRTIEHNMLHEVAEFEDVLVSTGGGTPCFFDNMAFMRQQGTTIYLKVSGEELAKRLELCKQTRPVLRNRSGEELKAFVQESLSARASFYEQAQIIFNADRLLTEVDAKELSAQIVQLLK